MIKIENKKVVIKHSAVTSIPDNQLCTVYQANNIIDIVSVQKRSKNFSSTRRISGTEYCNTLTGEIMEYKSHERISSDSLRNTFIQLRRLINNNFVGSISELMLVLTYAISTTDPKQLYQDFKRFWPKLQYHYGLLSYIAVIEPQHTGSFHFHVLVKKSDGLKLFIPNEHLEKLWGQGFTYVQRIKNVDNLGAYLCSYFTDVDVLEGTDIDPSGKSKMIIKKARLKFYPPELKIYRCSRDIKRVTPITIPYWEVKKLVGYREPVYQSEKQVVQINSDGLEKELNTICYQQYNKNFKENEYYEKTKLY